MCEVQRYLRSWDSWPCRSSLVSETSARASDPSRVQTTRYGYRAGGTFGPLHPGFVLVLLLEIPYVTIQDFCNNRQYLIKNIWLVRNRIKQIDSFTQIMRKAKLYRQFRNTCQIK
jgi:hypothetical protein